MKFPRHTQLISLGLTVLPAVAWAERAYPAVGLSPNIEIETPRFQDLPGSGTAASAIEPVPEHAAEPIFSLRTRQGLSDLESTVQNDFVIANSDIVPDDTLGTERTIVTPVSSTEDRIEGGAIRGENLFHSFEQFNIGETQSVYFSPQNSRINHIFGRITGNSSSDILGTLGVRGNANLYLINPNGFIFGEDATLNISGAFTATTAGGVAFSNQSVFSTRKNDQIPILTVDVTTPLGFQFVGDRTGDISTNDESDLFARGDFSLDGQNLLLRGQLTSGGNLTMVAEDALQISDSILFPFVARASEELRIEGRQSVSIHAYDNSGSYLASRGDTTLRSTDSITGNANYWTGGDFVIESTEENEPVVFRSPLGAVIRALGNIQFDNYRGGSLHVLSGGGINIDGEALLESLGEENTTIKQNIQLRDGNANIVDPSTDSPIAIDIDGNEELTLDVRAGISPNASIFVLPENLRTQEFFGIHSEHNIENSDSHIVIGSITLNDTNVNNSSDTDNGLVFLTTNYEANDNQNRDITVGIDPGFGFRRSISTFGDVIISSGRDIYSDGIVETSTTNNSNRVAGAISLIAANGKITARGNLCTNNGFGNCVADKFDINSINLSSPGHSGNILLLSRDNIRIENDILAFSNQREREDLNSNTISITSTRGSVEVVDSNIVTADFGIGLGLPGSIFISAYEGIDVADSEVNSQSVSESESEAINVNITSEQGEVRFARSSLIARNESSGLAGVLKISGRDGVFISDGGINSQSNSVSESIASNISISSDLSSVNIDGSTIVANNEETGLAGNISIIGRDEIVIHGTEIRSESNNRNDFVLNNIEIASGQSSVFIENSQISSSTQSGIAGNITIRAADLVALSSDINEGASKIQAVSTQGGTAGGIAIVTDDLTITDSFVSVSSETGIAGSIGIDADRVFLERGELSAVAGVSSQSDVSAEIKLTLSHRQSDSGIIRLSDESTISARARSRANGGNVDIVGQFIIADDSGPNGSDIIAEAVRGEGGRVDIDVDGSFNIRERPIVAGNRTNDISASSEFGAPGQVNLNTVGDPSNELSILPETPVETEVVSSCQAASSSTEALAFFDVGRGGSRTTPEDSLSSETGLETWVSLPNTAASDDAVLSEDSSTHRTDDSRQEDTGTTLTFAADSQSENNVLTHQPDCLTR